MLILHFVSLLQLESLIAVAEEGHIGRAAKRLHICQPPLTRRIRNLEEELGTPLFDRTSRGMRLRPEGECLVAHARTILRLVEVARNAIKGSTPPIRRETHRKDRQPIPLSQRPGP